MAEEQVERGPTPIEEIDLEGQVARHGKALDLVAMALRNIDGQLNSQRDALKMVIPVLAMLVVAPGEGRTFAEVLGDYSPAEIVDKMREELERIFAESGAE